MFAFNILNVHISSKKYHEPVYFTTMSIFLIMKFINSQNVRIQSMRFSVLQTKFIGIFIFVVCRELKWIFAVLLVLGIIWIYIHALCIIRDKVKITSRWAPTIHRRITRFSFRFFHDFRSIAFWICWMLNWYRHEYKRTTTNIKTGLNRSSLLFYGNMKSLLSIESAWFQISMPNKK